MSTPAGRAPWYDHADAKSTPAAAENAAAKPADATAAAGAAVKIGTNSSGAFKRLSTTSPHKIKKPFIIGVTGGTASGKTTVCQSIIDQLNLPWVVCLSMDSFYRPLTENEMKNSHNHNFDHPDSFDWATMRQCLKDIRDMKSVKIPRYDFKTHSRLAESDVVYGADVVLVEGILVLYDAEIRDMYDMKIFVDTDADLRLARRLQRDVRERGRAVDQIIQQYTSTVKPSFDDFIFPTKRWAHIIVPFSERNNVAVDLLCQHIRSQLVQRGVEFADSSASASAAASKAKPAGASTAVVAAPSGGKAGAGLGVRPFVAVKGDGSVNPNYHLLPESKNVKAIMTVIRDRTTKQEELQFAVARLCRLLFSYGMELAPYESYTVTTPTGAPFTGTTLKPTATAANATAVNSHSETVCAVTIVRSGEALERTFRESFPDVSVGKIVITQNSGVKQGDGPRLYYCKFPKAVETFKRVLLMDAVLATGNAAVMAVHVLLDHGVKESNIVYFCLSAAPQGIHMLLHQFPQMHVCVASEEDGLNEQRFVVPGVGALGDRYFGTDQQTEEFVPTPTASPAATPTAATVVTTKPADKH